LEMCVFLGHNVNLVLPCWDGEQLKQPDAMLVTEQTLRYIQYVVKTSGVSTYRWIDAYE